MRHGGLLVPARAPEARGAAILRLRDQPAWAAELGRAGRRFVVARFSTRATVERREELYRRLARSGADRRRHAVD